MPLNLLRLVGRRSNSAGNSGEIGKLDFRIGNESVGQGVYLTGTTATLPVETGDIAWDGHEVTPVAVSTTAVALTSDILASSHQYAMITCEAAAVRFWLDGTSPTATVGHILNPNDMLILDNQNAVDNASFISKDGGTATLQVSYGNRATA